VISPTTLVIVGALAGAFGLGHLLASTAGDARLAELRGQMSRSQAAQAEHASRRLLDAQTHGDTLTRQLAAATRAASRLRKERDDALQTATTGRVCLDTAALRVLDGAPGLAVALPTATSGTAAADGAVATDTDVARWALGAGDQYEECRRRLDALIDFHPAEAQQ
jgi:hypothetical protein